MLWICCFERKYSLSFFSKSLQSVDQALSSGCFLQVFPKFWTLHFFWMSPTTKNLIPAAFLHASPHPSLGHRPHIRQKLSLIACRQILPKIWSAVRIFISFFMTYLKNFTGLKSLNTKQCPAGLSSRIIALCTLLLTKNSPSFNHALLPPSRVNCPNPVMYNRVLQLREQGKSKTSLPWDFYSLLLTLKRHQVIL